MTMRSFETLASDLAALRQQHALDMSLLVDRLSSMEDTLHQLLLITCGHQSAMKSTGGLGGPLPRTSNLGRSSVPAFRTSTMGISSVHSAALGEMQQTHKALQLKRSLHSLRQVESTSGVDHAQQSNQIAMNQEPLRHVTSSMQFASASASRTQEWGKNDKPQASNAAFVSPQAGESAYEKMHLLGDSSICSVGGDAATTLQGTERSTLYQVRTLMYDT